MKPAGGAKGHLFADSRPQHRGACRPSQREQQSRPPAERDGHPRHQQQAAEHGRRGGDRASEPAPGGSRMRVAMWPVSGRLHPRTSLTHGVLVSLPAGTDIRGCPHGRHGRSASPAGRPPRPASLKNFGRPCHQTGRNGAFSR